MSRSPRTGVNRTRCPRLQSILRVHHHDDTSDRSRCRVCRDGRDENLPVISKTGCTRGRGHDSDIPVICKNRPLNGLREASTCPAGSVSLKGSCSARGLAEMAAEKPSSKTIDCMSDFSVSQGHESERFSWVELGHVTLRVRQPIRYAQPIRGLGELSELDEVHSTIH